LVILFNKIKRTLIFAKQNHPNMNNPDYKGQRYSYTALNEVYFWTITVNNWQHLLGNDAYKQIVMSSLQWLCQKELVKIYGYVIMPNHIHLLWEQLKMNGSEFPKNSFEKFTAHQFARQLKKDKNAGLEKYKVAASDRQYNFWQRDPLAVQIRGRAMAGQKLEYIHNNPLQPHWNLCSLPEDYRFSSAAFYEKNMDEFKILTHYMDVF
jgi:putative transposase